MIIRATSPSVRATALAALMAVLFAAGAQAQVATSAHRLAPDAASGQASQQQANTATRPGKNHGSNAAGNDHSSSHGRSNQHSNSGKGNRAANTSEPNQSADTAARGQASAGLRVAVSLR